MYGSIPSLILHADFASYLELKLDGALFPTIWLSLSLSGMYDLPTNDTPRRSTHVSDVALSWKETIAAVYTVKRFNRVFGSESAKVSVEDADGRHAAAVNAAAAGQERAKEPTSQSGGGPISAIKKVSSQLEQHATVVDGLDPDSSRAWPRVCRTVDSCRSYGSKSTCLQSQHCTYGQTSSHTQASNHVENVSQTRPVHVD